MADSAESAPIRYDPRDGGDLVRHFAAGEKAAGTHRVGVEHEKIVVDGSGRAPGYAEGIGPLLEGLAGQDGWRRVEEQGTLIGLQRGPKPPQTVSLEPGGQFELSDSPRATARDAARAVRDHLAELDPIVRRLGLRLLATGFRPFGTLDDVPWMPKGRYRVMREWMPRHGTLGHEMMKRTATVQANLDYADASDCADKMRTAMGTSSLVTALWAASPLVDGRVSGYQSYRAAAWLDTDNARCGLLPFVFTPGFDEEAYRRYAEWALDVPMFFIYRDERYLPVGEIPFRRFLAEGFQGERATLADWETHLSTLFPEVRLKQYLEVRGADASTVPMVQALPALYRGLLYDREARAAGWSLVESWSFEERLELRRAVPRLGLAAKVRGRAILPLARELVQIARAGLARLGDDDVALLDPVIEIAESGRTRADEIAAVATDDNDPARLLSALSL